MGEPSGDQGVDPDNLSRDVSQWPPRVARREPDVGADPPIPVGIRAYLVNHSQRQSVRETKGVTQSNHDLSRTQHPKIR